MALDRLKLEGAIKLLALVIYLAYLVFSNTSYYQLYEYSFITKPDTELKDGTKVIFNDKIKFFDLEKRRK